MTRSRSDLVEEALCGLVHVIRGGPVYDGRSVCGVGPSGGGEWLSGPHDHLEPNTMWVAEEWFRDGHSDPTFYLDETMWLVRRGERIYPLCRKCVALVGGGR